MSRIVFALSLLLITSSCGTTYYYAQLDSTNPYLEKDKTGSFTSDADSMRITYSFNGENAPIQLQVLNKMKQKTYIDWQSSRFIFGDNDENSVNLSQYILGENGMSLILPYSSKTETLFELRNLEFHKIKDEKFELEQIESSNKEKLIMLKSLNFDENTSPLYIKSELAFRLSSPESEALIFEHDFYISKLMKSKKKKEIYAIMNQQGDNFHTKKVHGKALRNVLKVGGGVLFISTIAVVEVILTPAEE